MKYLVAFPGFDCETVEADGYEITHGGVLWFYRKVAAKGVFGPIQIRQTVKAFKVWFWMEPESD